MNTKILAKTFVIALAMVITLTIGSSMVFGQDKADNQSANAPTEANSLEGTWQSVVTPRDCLTGMPAPFSFKTLETYMPGGTMSEDNATPFDGPYRTSGHGVWRQVHGRQYAITFLLYHFLPDKTFLGTVKVTINRTLSHDFNSSTGTAVNEIYAPNGTLVDTGCVSETSTRFTF